MYEQVMTLAIQVALVSCFLGGSPQDEAAIRQTTEAFFDAWNRHDISALVSHWAEDATIINPDGRIAHGRKELKQLFAEARAASPGTSEHLSHIAARFLSPDLAWVDVDLLIRAADAPDTPFHLVGLVQKKGTAWLWAEGRPYAFMRPVAGAGDGGTLGK